MNTVWACLCAGDILLRKGAEDGAFSLPTGDEPPVPLKPWNVVTKLEIKDDRLKMKDSQAQPSLISNLSSLILSVVRLDRPVVDVEGLEMMGLRASFQVLSQEEYTLAGKAAELIYWDQNTKYCGCCGAPTKWMTDISKKCSECGKEWWPSVGTAIIVRVTRPIVSTGSAVINPASGGRVVGDSVADTEVLLVRAKNFRRPHHGLVAGFLETGESLVDAVRREVREETGIEIKNIRYFDSQPWPYPFGLMVGFTADYAGGELRLQKEELSEGGWFTRDNMPQIPDKASIARRLIDDWLESPRPTKDIYLAGGCFWGTEHYFKQIEGVVLTEVGFANGHTENPTYKEVYTDTTGFAETVLVRFYPDVVSLEFLLRMFFKAIDPTSLNKQGHDEGTRYRTGVYYTDPADLPVIEKVFAEEQKNYEQPLAVEKLPLQNFYTAEEYHQDYLDKNPDGYCHLPLSLFEFARKANIR